MASFFEKLILVTWDNCVQPENDVASVNLHY